MLKNQAMNEAITEAVRSCNFFTRIDSDGLQKTERIQKNLLCTFRLAKIILEMSWKTCDEETWLNLIKICSNSIDDCSRSNFKKQEGKIFLGDSYLLCSEFDQKYLLDFSQLPTSSVSSSTQKVKKSMFSSHNVTTVTIDSALLFYTSSAPDSFLDQFKSNLSRIAHQRTTHSIKKSPEIMKSKYKGIAGIEQKLKDKRLEDDRNIDNAFDEGLKGLAQAAKDMIELSKKISKTVKEKTGEISADETVQLRAALMSLGVENSSDVTEVDSNLVRCLRKDAELKGGVLLLSDVFCIVNRLKGYEMMSPDDTLSFVKSVSRNNPGINFRKYSSGAYALEFGDQSSIFEDYRKF